MHIVSASQLLVQTVNVVIAKDMAVALLRRGADLQNDIMVINILLSAGFGLPSILALRARAAEKARALIARQGQRVH